MAQADNQQDPEAALAALEDRPKTAKERLSEAKDLQQAMKELRRLQKDFPDGIPFADGENDEEDASPAEAPPPPRERAAAPPPARVQKTVASRLSAERPVTPAVTESLERQIAYCGALIEDIADYVMRDDTEVHACYGFIDRVSSLIQSSAAAGTVIGRLRGQVSETKHTMVMEEKRKGVGVAES
jgi:hypothetical protein